MSDISFFVIGIMASLHGVRALEYARAGQHFRPWPVLGAFVAGYLAHQYGGWLLAADGWLRLSGWALLFGTAAPALGYVLYGHDGRIIRLLVKTVVFLVLTVIMTVLWLLRLEPLQALMVGGLTTVLLFLPWSSILIWSRGSREQRRERRRQRQAATAQTKELRRRNDARGEVRKLRRLAKRSSRTLHAQQQRLAALERGEHQERARLADLRKEVTNQVRLIREAEVEHIKAGDDTLEFHPHYGFLMAEAWRTLRAEIASGQRSAAIEHDAFFFQVLEDLLDAPDFERRYLHETGRLAMTAVNGYLGGGMSFSIAQAGLDALEWSPDLLAPIPVRGELAPGLLAAWLVPLRRRQQLEWQLFCAGDHPRQGQLNEFFDEREIELPTGEEWCRLWDEHPGYFV